MHLHSVLAHLEFVGDLLVCKTAADGLDDFHLSLRQSTSSRQMFVPVTAKHITHRHECTAGLDKADRLNGEVIRHARWNVAACAIADDPRDLVGTSGV